LSGAIFGTGFIKIAMVVAVCAIEECGMASCSLPTTYLKKNNSLPANKHAAIDVKNLAE
jgi:hypothetical protein